jgi:hypothetical protein
VANYLLPDAGLPFARIEELTPEQVRVRVHGHVGRTCVLEASTNLRDWTPISTVVSAAGGMLVSEAKQGSEMRFYRVREP